MRVICLNKRWPHHTSHGGYDRMAEALDAIDIRSQLVTSLPARLIEKAWSYGFGHKPHVAHYGFADRVAEERAFWAALWHRAPILHALYADEQLDALLRRSKLLPGHLVATFHLPGDATRERFEHVQREELRRLAGAIVVSSNEVPAFAGWLGPGKVMYVPHGIDVAAFVPRPWTPGARLRLVFVGFHMRDFNVAHRVVDRCARDGIPVDLDIVLQRKWHGYFVGCDNVVIHTDIPESQLIDLYCGADALFLPVIGATATNAVLEALACGTPVISTNVGGIRDYVDPSCGWLLPAGDVEAAFQCVRNLADAPRQAAEKRASARQKAESFAWSRVAEQVKAGYQRLLENRSFAPS